MASLGGAPILSTPDTRIFQEAANELDSQVVPRLSDEQLSITYEIQRTIAEIRAGKWKRIALQFPDHMLSDAPRVFTALSRGLKQAERSFMAVKGNHQNEKDANSVGELSRELEGTKLGDGVQKSIPAQLFILADTSYGACCVDEVAAEHADVDVVVHYGRSCLSPTARLPVIYVFTKPPLDVPAVVKSFELAYPDLDQKIILMADIPYAAYLPEVSSKLKEDGYTHLFETGVVHDTASPLPNRTVPDDVSQDGDKLSEYSLFHVSDPPASLLLTLASRVSSINIYPTTTASTSASTVKSAAMLRRRYALLTSITTVPIFGILINTLSVKNYMHILAHVKEAIAAARKKSYVFVVGKVNAAKVANFAEVGAWVVIGCWESSLFDSKDFWKPIITPFELELALQGDEQRIWTGQWTSDFGIVLRDAQERKSAQDLSGVEGNGPEGSSEKDENSPNEDDSEEESEPPEFDLRTGRYVSHSRPMKPSVAALKALQSQQLTNGPGTAASQSLIKRANGDLAMVGNAVSPAAQFFREKRTWQGLGSDYEVDHDADLGNAESIVGHAGAAMEQGRVGIARGYVVGEEVTRR